MSVPRSNLAGLFEMFDLAQLLPNSHAAYRPLLMDGLQFFLERLRPARLNAILAEQIALPPATRSASRLLVLFRQCPTLHKLGQVVAHDRRLAPEMRRRLQELESRGPYGGAGKLEPDLWSALGAVPGLEISSKALAEGSVAHVVPCLWRESAAAGARRGVLKILRPGIGDKLHEELAILGELAPYLEERRLHHRLPEFDYVSALDSVARLLVNEVRLDQEQRNLAAAARFYAGSPTVVIPRLLPFCTDRITAMERIDGVKVTDSGLTAAARRRLAASLADALLAKPLWSRWKSGVMFHADPHAGNLHVTADGRVAILDWALVAEIDKRQREAVIQVVVGALTFDHERIRRALGDLGEPLDGDSIDAAVAAAVARVRRGEFPGMAWLTTLLDELSAQRALRFPEAIILFRKALLTLSGVIADVSSTASIDAVVMREGWLDLVEGLALRPLVALDSRGHGGHLSTADLVGLWAGLPATVARYWRRR
jgi:ubiquinone biosynthesis protein